MHGLAAVDLNLVHALHALLEERSVTRAAARVGLSQPAMSHALSRLREHFGDPLLVRAGRVMVLTARAEELKTQVRGVVQELESLLVSSRQPLAPHLLETRLRLVTDDGIGVTLLPGVLRAVREAAPGVDVDVLPRGAPGRKALLRMGRADLALGFFSGAGLDLHRQHLYDDDWVCVLRQGHPALEGRLDAARWASLPHVIVSPTGGARGQVDTALHSAGLARRVAVTVPHFLAALALVAASDLVLTTPLRVARTQAAGLQLALLEPPVPLPPIPICMLWDGRTHQDPVQRWLRSVVVAASGSLAAAPGAPPPAATPAPAP
jgi:DNA-binding transcriptional LysR family regulator